MQTKNDILRKNVQSNIKSQLKSIFSHNEINLNPATMELLQGITPPTSPRIGGQQQTNDTKENVRRPLVSNIKPGQIIPTNISPTPGKNVLETERD